jgi:translation initiation factor 1A
MEEKINNDEEFEDRTEKISYDEKKIENNSEPIKIRVRIPKKNEIIGIIEQRLGGNKSSISCFDGKKRICRVPGRLRRRLWLKVEDVVIIEPWELDDKKGDIVFKYPFNQLSWLKKKGYLKQEKVDF